MITNRELTIDDYSAMLRRRLKVILIPTLLAPLVGFGVSYFFSPKYTSQTTILVEQQKVPEGYVKSVVNDDIVQRVGTLQTRATSAERLRPLIEQLSQQGVVRGNPDSLIEEIRAEMVVQPVAAFTVTTPGQNRKTSTIPGFNLSFTASNPRMAQAVCSGLAAIIINENLKDRTAAAQNTSDFLSRQLEEDKNKLDGLDSKLADFKKHYMGQLPGDAENNLKILMGLNSQLDANTQTLNRAQQDKSYAESMLAQQVAAWKSSQNATNPQSLQQQLATLQAQLVTLQARYTEDYPDVVKTKRDIAEIQKKLKELNDAAENPAAAASAASEKESLSEPPEIRQLRLQVHQYQDVINQATRDQQRIQQAIKLYEGRVALSPTIEEQYKELTRDYETEQKVYDDDLAKMRESEKQIAMEREQQGQQMRVMNPADLPDSPSFPNRLFFAGGGLGAGLALGFALALWLEFRDTALRTESDVTAALELPVLSQVPWVGAETGEKNGYGRRLGSRYRKQDRKETVEV